MIKKILLCISVVMVFTLIICAVNDKPDDKQYDEKIITPQIDIYLNNSEYTITIDGIVCVENIPIEINTINYQITNITTEKEINDINVFTFSVHNSTHQKYKNKEIHIDFTIHGSGYIMNKK